MDNLYNKIAYETSRLITKTYSTSFFISVRMLSPEMRKAIYSIYGFVRFADEIVDTFLASNQSQLLDNFIHDLNDALSQGISMNPVLHSFALTTKRYKIPVSYVKSFLKSMQLDLVKKVYENNSETDEYIYGSAEVVGLMCLKVFLDGNTVLFKELEKQAMKLGSAFQKVNFLRDLKSDYEKLNRQYFSDFNKESFDENNKLKLINNIDADFKAAKTGIKKLPGKSKFAVLIAYYYYRKLLHKLKNTPGEKIISARIRVSGFMKLILLIKVYFVYKLNLI
jgi:phytoene synthase